MPRPEIKGLKYFPFDVGFFRDKKIRLLRGENGAEGVEIYLRLIAKCYEDNGYFLDWDTFDDYALLADESGYPEDKVRLIVSTCLRRSLFDNILFKVGNVLTSRSIQRRYFSAIKDTKIKAAAQGRYTYIDEDLCLLTEEDFSELNKPQSWLKVTPKKGFSENNENKSENNTDKSEINPANKTKLNKTKEKETKQDHSDELCRVFNCYEKVIKVPTEADQARLTVLCKDFTADVVIQAINSAAGKGRSVNYVKGILNNWKASGDIPRTEKKRETSYDANDIDSMDFFNLEQKD